MTTEDEKKNELMTPGEVALLFKVDPKTVSRWARSKRLPSIVTPGGHHRFYREDVETFIAQAKAGGQMV